MSVKNNTRFFFNKSFFVIYGEYVRINRRVAATRILHILFIEFIVKEHNGD